MRTMQNISISNSLAIDTILQYYQNIDRLDNVPLQTLKKHICYRKRATITTINTIRIYRYFG